MYHANNATMYHDIPHGIAQEIKDKYKADRQMSKQIDAIHYGYTTWMNPVIMGIINTQKNLHKE